MTGLQIEGAVLTAFVISMLLISWGSSSDGSTALTVIGGVVLAASLVTLTVLRYVDLEEE